MGDRPAQRELALSEPVAGRTRGRSVVDSPVHATLPADTGSRATVLRGSNGRRWRLPPPPDLTGFADAGPGLPPLMQVLLAHRAVRGTADARRYLGRPGELTDASLMPNLDIAVDRLARACRDGEMVAIIGDFDVDGVTATTILVEGLRALGARPEPYIPNRFTEGYGPNVAAVRRLADAGATVLVTADCGTSSVAEIAEANASGMDALVLDHHTVPEVLPAAFAIVNPKLNGSAYGSEPAAVGVAYKVVHDLHDRLGRPYDPDEHRALVALGTVCDLAPLVAENRDLVRIGIEALARTRRPGLLALAAVANANLAQATPDTCGWVLGPRLNAAGRMEHARLALDLLLTDSPARARELAETLEALNLRRRETTQTAIDAARASLTADDLAGPLLIAASPDVSMGVVGPVASRLVEEYSRPAIVMQLVGGEGRASCRSIPDFDITALLRRHAHLFLRFGGHRAAAGFTIDAARLDELKATLIADAADHLDTSALAPTIEVDAELHLPAVNRQVLQWLALLGPHGIGNPTPTFLARSVRVADSRVVGREGEHLQLTLREGNVSWRAISFRNAAAAVPAGELADIVYTFKRDDFRDEGGLQLEVLDLRPAEALTVGAVEGP
ncbi:MAG: single-stranded-DNA-specific exonuclease RecJ [Chloroflexi bacterium]|nr:single-stranded-DNA-specific exonuclease RecJ [Chloroflexota bacterium]